MILSQPLETFLRTFYNLIWYYELSNKGKCFYNWISVYIIELFIFLNEIFLNHEKYYCPIKLYTYFSNLSMYPSIYLSNYPTIYLSNYPIYLYYIICSSPPSIRVHAGKDVYPGVVYKLDDLLVSSKVGVTQVVGQVEQHFSSQYLQNIYHRLFDFDISLLPLIRCVGHYSSNHTSSKN